MKLIYCGRHLKINKTVLDENYETLNANPHEYFGIFLNSRKNFIKCRCEKHGETLY